ncbi:hypothetical protein QN226_31390, partial [Sinorhizobium sp. 6-117]|nr:hypothetical protein [Sinorhizobium sp. 6-117]
APAKVERLVDLCALDAKGDIGALDAPFRDLVALYRSLKSKDYPTRFVLFETGSHGTPVRMTDWRDALNWIASR